MTPVLTSDWLVQVGLVLSDMAPNLSGNPGHDHEAITQLVYTVLRYTVLYCTALYCTVLYCTVLYCTVLQCVANYGQ